MNIKKTPRVLVTAFTLMTIAIIFTLIFINRSSSTLLLAIFPPDGLYRPMINEPIDLSTPGKFYSFAFTNKYPGNYSAGLFIENTAPFGEPYSSSPTVSVTISKNDRVLLAKSINLNMNKNSRFFGGDNRSGEVLIWYKSPQDLPINEELICEVSISKAGEDFHGNYGAVRFYLKKMSDL